MSLDFTGTQSLVTTSGVPSGYTTGFTVCFWMQSDVAGANGDEAAASIYESATSELLFWHQNGGAGGTTQIMHYNSFSSGAGPTVTSTTQWYFICMTWDTSAHGFTRILWRAEADETLTSAAGGSTWVTPAPVNFTIGDSPYGSLWDGRITYVKSWNTLLSDAEILTESNQATPTKTADLIGWWPLTYGDETTDYSGNNYTLTPTGTMVDGSDEPNIPYGGASPAATIQHFRKFIGGM